MSESPLENAPVWRRIVATGIDYVIVPLMSFLIMIISGAMETADAYAGHQPWIRGVALGIAAYLLLNGWLLHRRGQTLGKWLLKIRMVDSKNNKIPPLWRFVCVRALFFPTLYLPLLYSIVGLFAIIPLIDLGHALRPDRRCLHDLAAGTRVVSV